MLRFMPLSKSTAVVFVLLASLLCFAATASAQMRIIPHVTRAVGVVEGSTALLTAVNLCSEPVHVVMQLVDGATGDPVGGSWDADVEPNRTAQLDLVVGAASGGPTPRLLGLIDVTPSSSATRTPKCLRGKNAPILGQLELTAPGGEPLLLPAVQKVREAAAR